MKNNNTPKSLGSSPSAITTSKATIQTGQLWRDNAIHSSGSLVMVLDVDLAGVYYRDINSGTRDELPDARFEARFEYVADVHILNDMLMEYWRTTDQSGVKMYS
jgi:hypothetical protein